MDYREIVSQTNLYLCEERKHESSANVENALINITFIFLQLSRLCHVEIVKKISGLFHNLSFIQR